MTDESTRTSPTRIDLGCGNARRPGFVGLDMFPGEQVDHVIDLTSDPYPFADDSVDEVFSAHFLEHIDEPNHVFSEIGRVCRDGAHIEFWTPYAWTNEALLYGHLHSVSEDLWNQFCLYHRDLFAALLRGRWLLQRVIYVIDDAVVADLGAHDVDLDFAIRYYKGVVKEMGVEIQFRRDLEVPPVVPERVWASTRFGPRTALHPRARTPSRVRSELSRIRRWLERIPAGRRSVA